MHGNLSRNLLVESGNLAKDKRHSNLFLFLFFFPDGGNLAKDKRHGDLRRPLRLPLSRGWQLGQRQEARRSLPRWRRLSQRQETRRPLRLPLSRWRQPSQRQEARRSLRRWRRSSQSQETWRPIQGKSEAVQPKTGDTAGIVCRGKYNRPSRRSISASSSNAPCSSNEQPHDHAKAAEYHVRIFFITLAQFEPTGTMYRVTTVPNCVSHGVKYSRKPSRESSQRLEWNQDWRGEAS